MSIQVSPEIWGPSVWASMHSYAYTCTDRESIKGFPHFMKRLINNLKCNDCKKHSSIYFDEHPINKKYPDSKDNDISILLWTWEFHNFVNKTLNKPIFEKDRLIKKYHPELLVVKNCTTCGGDPDKEIKRTEIPREKTITKDNNVQKEILKYAECFSNHH